jgi:HD-GYP domain-containing protein (c-di-GMP phosphodiesterase class II)
MFSAYSNEEGNKIAYGHIFKYFISEMIKTLKKTDNTYYDFTDYRNLETYCNFHMINVTCISLVIGYNMKLDEKDLLDLGVGALLYDLKMDMYKFVNQDGKLNEIEKEEMQQHTFMSFDTMRKIYGISSKSASIAFQHHERIDGSGYPKRLKGDDIGALSKIVAVADVYDAYISKRPFREAYHSDEAWNYIVENKGILFEEKETNIFKKVISKYLPGSIVELNTGDKARVLYNDVKDMENPMIKVIEKKGKSDIIFDTKSFYLKDEHRSVIRILESIG